MPKVIDALISYFANHGAIESIDEFLEKKRRPDKKIQQAQDQEQISRIVGVVAGYLGIYPFEKSTEDIN